MGEHWSPGIVPYKPNGMVLQTIPGDLPIRRIIMMKIDICEQSRAISFRIVKRELGNWRDWCNFLQDEIRDEDFADCYARWVMGRCPCCGGEVCDWEFKDVYACVAAIGEGVYMCGRCVGNEHDSPADFVENMLSAIAKGARNARRKEADNIRDIQG